MIKLPSSGFLELLQIITGTALARVFLGSTVVVDGSVIDNRTNDAKPSL